MTPGFIAAVAALVLITLALLTRPFWWRGKGGSTLTQRKINIAIYRDQLDELERDRSIGSLAETDYTTAREETQRRLLEDGSAAEEAPATFSAGRATLITIALLVPLVAGGLYAWLGNPAALNPPEAQHKVSAGDIERMVATLAAKLEQEPENTQGWLMLARSYRAMGRFPEAVGAYERSIKLVETDAQMLADYADVLAASNQGFNAKAMELLGKALKLDPDHAQALWLRGTAAFDAGQFKQAVSDWERLKKQLAPGSDDARSVAASIDEARSKGGMAKAVPKAVEKKVGAGGTAAVSGRVELAAALKGKAAAGDTVMVIARPADGSRMPVAVLRVPVSSLPLKFSLDDTLAMSPDHAISKFPEVLVEARVSKTGMAMPQSGDLIAAPQKVKVGQADIVLQVDQVRP